MTTGRLQQSAAMAKVAYRSSAKMASPAKVGPMMEDIDTLMVLKVTPDLGAAWPIRDGK